MVEGGVVSVGRNLVKIMCTILEVVILQGRNIDIQLVDTVLNK